MPDGFKPSEWITTAEAAELTGYSPVTFRWLVREGKIYGRKRGRDWFLDKESVLSYAKRMKDLGPAKHAPRKKQD
jgi:excisionase family DNA binding protein